MAATTEAIEMTQIAAQAAADKLGRDIVGYDVSDRLAITDVFLIVTASNERQISAVCDAIEEALFTAGHKLSRREGDRYSQWVLLDFRDIVVHVQHTEARALYSLERLWRDCPAIDIDVDEAPASAADEAYPMTEDFGANGWDDAGWDDEDDDADDTDEAPSAGVQDDEEPRAADAPTQE